MKKSVLAILLCALLESLVCNAQSPTSINLAGDWQFALDPGHELTPASSFTDRVWLPGTTDTNKKGTPLNHFDDTSHLSRLFSYNGPAWYSRQVDIPLEWVGKKVCLLLERTKYTEVYVDGKSAGHCNDISTPQRYDLTPLMTPGVHTLTIMVDNMRGIPQQLYANSHACTEDTQTNWNGIIGRIELVVNPESQDSPDRLVNKETLTVRDHHFYQNGHRIFLRGKHDACVWPLTGHVPMDVQSWLDYLATCTEYGINHVRFHSWCPPEAAFSAADSLGIILQPELPFWGDFNDSDSVLMTFLHKEGENILREYGRHRSFRMFALGNELWGNIDKMAEFIGDFRRIAPDKLYTFGSNYYLGYQGVKAGMDYFTTCRVGGEQWGSYNTHVRGSFSFADVADGGVINHFRPNAFMNFERGCQLSDVPVISHETGQFQTYPDYGEIGKYSGVLRPCNLEVFRKRLADAGMADQADDFHRASGLLSKLLYKQDIEMDLRTPSMAGFQLLDLQDYPGQGSAYVGILDAFMQPKDLCTAEEWRQFCSPVVPLLVSDAYCFTFGQGIHGKVQLANYSGGSLAGQKLKWELCYEAACSRHAIEIFDPIASGTMTIPEGEGLLDLDALDIDLSSLPRATQLLLMLEVSGTDYRNSYNLWAYPDQMRLNKKGIVITDVLTDEIGKKLQNGAKVLFMPHISSDTISLTDSPTSSPSPLPASLTVGGLFQTDYWNYGMFKTISENNKKPVSPGTLGILCDPEHGLFQDFPTDMYTQWQWWPVIKESHPFILDGLTAACPSVPSSYRPLVQVIDNVERNHKLGLVFEFQVGKGKLLVVMSNLEKAAQWPEGRQFYASILNYMHSLEFVPQAHITFAQLHALFTKKD